jgi:hypothetical protein
MLWRIGLTPDLIEIAVGRFDPPSFWFPINRALHAQ